MRKQFFRLCLLVIAIATIGTAQKSRATLLAYEGFDYTAGTTIGGQTGGSGWTNAWANGSSQNLATNVADSLTYADVNGQALLTTGGSLVVGNPAGTTSVNANPNRLIPGNLSLGTATTAGPGATNWISFLYKRLNFVLGPYLRQANFGLFEGSGERVDICGPNTGATVSNVLSAWGGGSVTHTVSTPFQAPDYPINSGSTYFILVKVVTDGTTAADTAYIWFNWTNLVVEPDISTATIVENEVNLSSVNTMRFQAGNQNTSGSNAVFQVDELRVGTDFTSVTPHQSAGAAPSISAQPQDQTVTVGDPVTFSVAASGDLPFTYQWFFKTNTPLLNATNATFNLASATTNDAGGYSVIVANGSGSVTSVVALLTVQLPVPPAFTSQPQNFTNVAGLTATFVASATGTPTPQYQWYFNTNTLLPGKTSATLTFTIGSTDDAGTYSVIATNGGGSATSAVARLTVIPASPPGLPAFPGADGAAKFVTGGRGGIVYHVTKLDRNLNDAAAGTLRYGLTDGNFPPGVPRTIVFDVAGTFWLGRYGAESNYNNGWDTSSRYNLSGNTTVAGQTAPGPVIIAGGTTKAGSANIIVRNVTFTVGYGMRGFEDPPTPPTVGDFPDAYVYDAIDISGQNLMLDHLTTLYATDESISCNELANNLTVQYCNVSQGQNYPQLDAESASTSYSGHSLAHLWQAGSNAKTSVINNLYAHEKGRLPRVGTEANKLTIVGVGAINDFRNNVFYNWLGTAGTGADNQPSANNFINNFYLAGPGGDNPVGGSNSNLVTSAGGTSIFFGDSTSTTKAYVNGNLKDTNKDGDPNDPSSADASYSSIVAQSAAYDVNIGVTLSPTDAFTNVLHYAGSRWWTRPYVFTLGNTGDISTNDIAAYVDERLIHETITGTGKIMAWADDPFNSDPNEGTEWRSLLALRADTATFAAPFNRPAGWDTDGDGMPDAWEIEHGLDPNVANNNGDFDNDGYTDLEEYLNDVAAWPAPGVIQFNNATNNRYAVIFNWSVNGATVNIGGTSTVTSSKWQPSRYDTALISNVTCVVDAVGQHAGILQLKTNAMLNLTNGWLNVADKVNIGAGCTVAVQYTGSLRVTNSIVNNGTLRLTGAATLTAGSLTNNGLLDIMAWNGTLPAGFVNNGVVLDYSLVRVGSATISGTNFVVTIQGYTGHNYQLQYRDDLAGDTWHDSGTAVAGGGASIILTHPGGATAQRRFYRVAVSP
jgi:hypothetical protein